ncbi:MAG: hypothetical protein NVSMB64_18590 [Candidatus Velthaea sp.]
MVRSDEWDRDETAVALKMLLDLIVEGPAIGEICKRSRGLFVEPDKGPEFETRYLEPDPEGTIPLA